MYLGFDRLSYPGDDVMQSLRQLDLLSFVGAYLAPAPNRPNSGWMDRLSDLADAGWGIAPIYVGQQVTGASHNLSKQQGVLDAVNAVDLAANADLAAGVVIYLDIEEGGKLTDDFLDYIDAWVSGVASNGCTPGVYCSHSKTADQINDHVGPVRTWVYGAQNAGSVTVDLEGEAARDPGTSHFGNAVMWQYLVSLGGRRVDLAWHDADGTRQKLIEVDVDSAVIADPSSPELPTPVIDSVAPPSGTAGDTVTIRGRLIGISDAALGATSVTDLVSIDESTIEFIVPSGLTGESLSVTLANRWGNSAQSLELFDIY